MELIKPSAEIWEQGNTIEDKFIYKLVASGPMIGAYKSYKDL